MSCWDAASAWAGCLAPSASSPASSECVSYSHNAGGGWTLGRGTACKLSVMRLSRVRCSDGTRSRRPRPGRRERLFRPRLSSGAMKVVLPDRSELELPDGASGLDAARAIGPKLAEQAVLVRANGATRDLRLPLADGDEIQILTTRDTHDAGRALRPPPFERASARGGGAAAAPGRQDRDRAADRERLLLRLRVSRADRRGRSRGDRGRDRAGRSPRGASGRARRSPATKRERGSSPQGEPYKVELVDTAEGDISLYTQGDFTDLCRGPHLQNAAPIKALKLTGLAGAYWRGDEKNTQLTRIYGTAFYSQADLDEHLANARARPRARPPPPRRAARPVPLRRALARLAVLAPEGDGDLQRPRGSAPPGERAPGLLRGADAADLRQGALGHLRSLGEVPREHVPDPARRRSDSTPSSP